MSLSITERQRFKSLRLFSICDKFLKVVSPKPVRWDGEKVLVALACGKPSDESAFWIRSNFGMGE